MIINFRQGIVTYPSSGGVQKFLTPSGNYVSLNTTNGVVDVAFAHRTSNYLHTESVSVLNAWGPFPVATTVWLYWDINNLTAERTFGYTQLEPIAQAVAPTPELDQHWFDTSTNIMKVWTGSRWQEKIRVFAAEYDTATTSFISVSIYSTSQRFDGTQVGISGQDYLAGRIIVDNTGRPILNQSNEFFTTEDDFFINGSPINTIRLEANILTAVPVENVANYQVVKFTEFDKVALASYHDLQTSAIAISMQDILQDDVGSFVVQGIITNPVWNWTQVGAQLWVSEGGVLVEADPHITDTVTYPNGKAPVGRVLSPHSIIFDQGLGGKGDKGDSALNNLASDAATQFELGKVKLTVAPIDPGSPYAVETNDPRMSDARHPLPHTHPAAEILPTQFGVTINGTLQTTLENIDNTKLNKTGDTMTGALILHANPTANLGAVTKQYLDGPADLYNPLPNNYTGGFVPRTQKGQPGGVATLGLDGKIPNGQLPQLAITDTFVVADQYEMLTADAQVGDLAVRLDQNRNTYIRRVGSAVPSQLSDWEEIKTRPDGVLWIDVVPAVGQEGIVTAGGPIGIGASIDSGQISISLANDLAAIEALTGTGVAHRTWNDTWEVKPVDLSNSVSNVLPMANGGTGLNQVFGYLKGNGTTFTSSLTIPGSDVVGAVGTASSVPWSGVTSTPTTLIGYGITDAYTKTETNALTWNWSSITNRPSTLIGYGITDVYSKTEVDTFLLSKANKATTLAGYGIVDAAPITHNHVLDNLQNVNTSTKATGDLLQWSGTSWVATPVSNATLPTIISNKIIDATNTITVRDNAFTVVDDADATKAFRFQSSGIAAATTRVYTAPDSDGTIALTNGTGAFGNWNINAASATTVPWSGVTTTPTTLAGYEITDAYTKTETNNLTWNWSSITNRPTTLVGYGITDAYTSAQVNALTWNWSSITNRPTTLTGYGITDAATSTHTHDALYLKPSDLGVTVASLDFTGKLPVTQLPDAAITDTFTIDNEIAMLALPATKGDIAIRTEISTSFILVTDDPTLLANWAPILSPGGAAGGAVDYVGMTAPVAGITVSGSPITASGTFVLSLADDLAAVENLTTVGFVKRTGTNTWSTTSQVDLSTDVSGVLPITNGGTGANNAATALANLGAVGADGAGATGTWTIDITGNSSTVTDGVYTTGSYADPSWITSIDPSKVVGTWTGSNNISTVGSVVSFDDITTIKSGSAQTTDDATPVVIDSFDASVFSSAKYLLQMRLVSTGNVNFTEIYVYIDGNNDVWITETGPQHIPVATITASYNAGTNNVELQATGIYNDVVSYKFSCTLITV